MGKVIIGKDAAISLLLASIEVFSKEAFGVLVGRRVRHNYSVRHAVSFQSTTRTYEYITVDAFKERRVGYNLRYLTSQKLIGDFHSHAGNFEKLSRQDVKELKEMGKGNISLLAIVKKTKKSKKWRYNASDKSLSGTVGTRFFIKLRAFEYDEEREKPIALRIKCDYVKTIDRLNKKYEKLHGQFLKLEKIKKKTLQMHRKLGQKLR